MGLDKFKAAAKQLKVDIPALFLAMKDKRTPILAKLLAGLVVAYALSPIDLIPDFIPVLGYLDDIILLPFMVAIVIKLIPEEIFSEKRKQASQIWTDGKPKKWYFAIGIVLIDLFILLVVYKLIKNLFSF